VVHPSAGLGEEVREQHMATHITATMDCRASDSGPARRSGSGQYLGRVSAWAVAAALVFLVCGCDDCSLKITTNTVPNAVVGVYYSFELSSECGGDTWFLASFDLPPGIGLQSDGDLVGVPTHAGIFSFTVGLVDYDSGDEAYQGYTLTVQPQLPTPFPTPLPTPVPTRFPTPMS
jgi:hypothetical protein